MVGINNVIATDMDIKTGRIIGKNCYGTAKVEMFKKIFGEDAKLKSFYSDSKSDLPMMMLAEERYFVHKNTVKEYKGEK